MIWVALAIAASLAAGVAAERRAGARARVAALVAPDALAPDVLVDASRVLVLGVPALGFFAIGVTLAEEAEDGALPFHPPLTPQVGAALLVRLLLAPLLLLALAAPFIDLPEAFILLAAMPAGLHIVALAHAYRLDLAFAASAIVWTTIVAVPVLLALAIIA